MTKMNDYSFCFSSLLNLSKLVKKTLTMTSQLRSELLQVIAYWLQANKESLNEEKSRQDRSILSSARFDDLSKRSFN